MEGEENNGRRGNVLDKEKKIMAGEEIFWRRRRNIPEKENKIMVGECRRKIRKVM